MVVCKVSSYSGQSNFKLAIQCVKWIYLSQSDFSFVNSYSYAGVHEHAWWIHRSMHIFSENAIQQHSSSRSWSDCECVGTWCRLSASRSNVGHSPTNGSEYCESVLVVSTSECIAASQYSQLRRARWATPYLPKYSPFLNSCEMAGSVLKAAL